MSSLLLAWSAIFGLVLCVVAIGAAVPLAFGVPLSALILYGSVILSAVAITVLWAVP